MKRYTVIDTDCESDVWFDNSENKILHYEEIEEILEKQDTKWQKLKEFLNEDKLFYLFKEEFVDGYKNCLLSIKNKMQELEAEDEN